VLLSFISERGYSQTAGFICNKGIAGNSSSDLLRRLNHDVIDLNPDLVIIMIGTNDLLNSKKMVSVSELIRNLERLSNSLIQHRIDVVMISPPPVDSLYLFERHDANSYPLPPNELLKEARTAMRYLCQKNKFLFIDSYNFFKSNGIPQHNKDEIIRNVKNSGQKDGVHFTITGNALLAHLIFEKLSEKYDHLSRFKIVCFGDSLTYGAFMEGEGTATGDTYPAALEKLITQFLKKE